LNSLNPCAAHFPSSATTNVAPARRMGPHRYEPLRALALCLSEDLSDPLAQVLGKGCELVAVAHRA
jgi:hypothetical protein